MGIEPSPLVLPSLPVLPCVPGFDPRLQLFHPYDTTSPLSHSPRSDSEGVTTSACDAVLPLSLSTSPSAKALPPVPLPWGPGFAAAQLRRLGLPVGGGFDVVARHGTVHLWGQALDEETHRSYVAAAARVPAGVLQHAVGEGNLAGRRKLGAVLLHAVTKAAAAR